MAGKQFWGKMSEDAADTLGVKNVVEIAIRCTVSEINVFSFMQKFKVVTKNGRKAVFCKKWQMTMRTPWRLTIVSKSLYLTLFMR